MADTSNIIPASITVLPDNLHQESTTDDPVHLVPLQQPLDTPPPLPPPPPSPPPTAHDVLKTILPDILADIAPHIPKGKMEQFLQNIKTHIPEDIHVAIPDTSIKLGLTNVDPVKSHSEHIIDVESVYQQLGPRNTRTQPTVPSSAASNASADSASSNNQGFLQTIKTIVNGKPKRKSKSNFCIIKQRQKENELAEIDREILGYIKKINQTIGYYWWKQYIYSAFWNYITTPINLAITVMTALTTGENATQGLISSSTATTLGVIVLCLSLFQTFFRSNDQYNINKAELAKWSALGTKFDGLYMDKVTDDNSITRDKEKHDKLANLQELFQEISQLKRDNQSNVCIDFFFVCLKCMCLRNNKINWMKDLSAEDEEDI